MAVELEARCAAAGVKLLLVRRHGRGGGGEARRRCMFVDRTRGIACRRDVDDPAELLSVPFSPAFGEPLRERQLLVCTNGKRDRCCASRGRPVAAALAAAAPERAWECSHLGGHRFAANLLVLPEGLLFGRVDPSAALVIVAALEEGELPLEHLRGRCGVEPVAQAAEIEARRALALTRLDALEPGAVAGHVVTLRGDDGRPVRARLEPEPLSTAAASCAGGKSEPAMEWRLLELSPTG